MKGKVIIISAPSGTGKSTIINRLMEQGDLDLMFSVSATSRPPRRGEQHGINYYFLDEDDFKRRIAENAFIEYEEVYPGRFYGTLKSEIDRILAEGHNVILDIDVKGAINVKEQYGDRAISIFIQPPSIATLRNRLESRGTDSPEIIAERVGKAEYELKFADKFDTTVVNDNLEQAVSDTHDVIQNFITR